MSFTSESSDHYLVLVNNGVLPDLKKKVENLPEPLENLYIQCVVVDSDCLDESDVTAFLRELEDSE